ncbi:ABC transporter permease [Streptococcus parauberis]|uniref:ABC transporter permease n=1 Tax=Streptococcus parauberis TaxID=1348 RepID=UPI00044541F4|nr:ABC transporter permease [Streptococcus parauberis]ONH63375.1 ABC transporter permease protein YxdM [Streptococcus parauberis]PCH11708.1 ABC transporter permease protein YxdM [Streptococcus parauberis]UWM91750.1 ABC transporter permease [Streptococcus parauberis]GAJ60988.1 transporter permease [Streptococcus parauberis]
MFYLKLAWNNLKKSKEVVAPFLLASTVLFVLSCIVSIILFSPITTNMSYGKILLTMAMVILNIFTLIMEIYSYNFYLKQRNREFGLYNILGMNKSQIGLVSSIELLIIFGLTIILGSLFSFIFSKLFYLIFVNLSHMNQLSLPFNSKGYIITSFLFLGFFVILELVGLLKIKKTSPLLLFQDHQHGELEPKGNILFAFLAILSIGIGYYLSLSSEKIAALAVLYRFFIAVVFVIIGTYLFYISFVSWYLKRKKANKRYYYKPEHFISTSQLIFRMKQNALGLANITLLACMAFVAIATTTALYTNTEDAIDKLFPKNTSIEFVSENESVAKKQLNDFVLKPLQLSQTDYIESTSTMLAFPGAKGSKLQVTAKDLNQPIPTKTSYTYLIHSKEFEKFGNKAPKLSKNQVAYFTQKGDSQLKSISVLGKTYQVVKNFKKVVYPDVTNTYYPSLIIVKDQTVFNQIVELVNTEQKYKIRPNYKVYAELNQKQLNQILDKSGNISNTKEFIAHVDQKNRFKDESYTLFGGFLFTGFLLGLTFIMGAALIIYYKQYTEGHQDKKSYKILQEVGMSQKQVKKTINSQILLVFFMPIIMSIIHFSVALVMIKQMLLLFGVTNTSLIYNVCASTIAIIIAIYFIIYSITSRTYYKIIER